MFDYYGLLMRPVTIMRFVLLLFVFNWQLILS